MVIVNYRINTGIAQIMCVIDLSNIIKRYESINKDGKPTEGYKRAKDILEHGKIPYGQMKRIKNWFDSFEGDHNDMEYRLNGGKTMNNWVNGSP